MSQNDVRIKDQQRVDKQLAQPTVFDTILEIFQRGYQQKLPRYLFLGLCFNLILAPAVFAATGGDLGDLSRSQAYWLTGLILAATALSIYLFVVMFAPEKF